MATQVKRLLVRLNAGTIPVAYTVEVLRPNRLKFNWWIEGCEGEDPALDCVERMIVDALIYGDTK